MRYRDTRLPSGKELRIERADQVSRVEIVNVSTTGAQLKLAAPLPQEALVVLCPMHLRYPARVVWSDGVKTGVRFVQPLTASDVTALRGAIGGASAGGSSSYHGFRELS